MHGRWLLGALVLAALVAAALAGSPGLAQEPGGWLVVRESLNLRAAPTSDAAVVTVMPTGAWVEVLSAADAEWAQVRYAGRLGYAARAYLAPPAPAATGPFTVNLPVPFHRQLTPVWCDPAIIQSWNPTQSAGGYSL
jgi:hypothetical protein